MDSFHKKFLALVLVFASVYLFFLYMRLKSLRIGLRDYSSNWNSTPRYSYSSEEVLEARERLRENFPIKITYAVDQSLISQAELFYNSGYDHTNLHTLKNIDICDSSTSTCITTDIRLFLHEYFRDFSESYLKRPIPIYVYYIPPDSEIHRSDFYKYKIFGGMFALALVTDAHIEIGFFKYIWCDPSQILYNMDGLHYIDREQNEIYREILTIKNNYWNTNNNYTRFSLNPSSKPFQRESGYSYFGSYLATSYPLQKAAEMILIEPYTRSREAIHEGSLRFLGFKYTETINITKISFNSLNTQALLLIWRDNSTCSSYNQCLKFWRAMSLLTNDELYRVYKAITEYHTFPSGGFSRLPKTQIVFEKDGQSLFPRRFKINLYYEFTVQEMYELLKNYPNN